jgi:uncharacterized protein (DUF1501 family)
MSHDTLHTRREFLHRGLTLLSATATVPAFLDRTAWALGDPRDAPLVGSRPGVDGERVLIVVQLAGGNDGLNTVVPYEDDRYYQARPRLAIAKREALRLTDELGLHPQAGGLKRLYDEGWLAIVQGVGYPNPDRSHFVSTDIWSTGDPTGRNHHGWLGRYFDCTCAGSERPSPRKAIALTTEAPLALQGRRFAPVSFGRPEELTWRGPSLGGEGPAAFEALNAGGTGGPTGGAANAESALAYLQRTAMDARASAAEIQRAAGASSGRRGGLARPGGGRRAGRGALGEQLEMVRRMIRAGLDTRVYYVSLGGFDTHAQQAGRHSQLMRELGDGLLGFAEALEEDGLLDRVLIMTFSEFGRRVAENASQGTDHGAAAPMLVVGSRIHPGLVGRHPSLDPSRLDGGDLKWGIDFRSVYAGVLKGWLSADARAVLGGRFTPMNIVRG